MLKPHRFVDLLSLALVFAALLTTACKNDLDRVSAVELPEAGPDRVTHQAEYFLSDSGRVRNRLRAGTIAEWTTEPRRTELSEGVQLDMIDANGHEVARLTARRGVIMPGDKRMEVFDQVVFVNAMGERLETEHLVWQRDSARVHTDKPVRIERRRDVIHGIGLDASEDMSRYTVRRITGILEPHAEDTLAADAKAR